MAGALNRVRQRTRPDDWLDAWSPEYIRTTLPTLRLLSDVYHRAEVRGLNNIPAEGPGAARGEPLRRHADRGHLRVLAGVLRPLRPAAPLPPARPRHGLPDSGRARLAVALRDRPGLAGEHGPRARARRRAARLSGRRPRDVPARAGSPPRSTSPAEPASCELAIEHDVPIVPVVAIGGQETALFLGRGRRFAKLLRLDSLLRLKVLPAQIGAAVRRDRARPSGSHPAARQDHGAGAAEDRPEAAAGAKPDIDEAYELVTGKMQNGARPTSTTSAACRSSAERLSGGRRRRFRRPPASTHASQRSELSSSLLSRRAEASESEFHRVSASSGSATSPLISRLSTTISARSESFDSASSM